MMWQRLLGRMRKNSKAVIFQDPRPEPSRWKYASFALLCLTCLLIVGILHNHQHLLIPLLRLVDVGITIYNRTGLDNVNVHADAVPNPTVQDKTVSVSTGHATKTGSAAPSLEASPLRSLLLEAAAEPQGVASSTPAKSSRSMVMVGGHGTVDSTADLACKFPILDPFDKSILKYVNHPKVLKCDQMQPYLTYLDETGRLWVNESEWNRTQDQNVTCKFRELDRANGRDDNAISRTEYKPLLPRRPESFRTDTAEVQCTSNITDNAIYYNLHAKPGDVSHNGTRPTDDKLSVLMFLVDSVALNMFRRHLNETYHYLTKEMGAYVFRGFNKVADNTFPNIIPMLTGKRVYTEQDDMPDEFGEDYKRIQYDHWDVIWKRYAKKGYYTAFIEDKPEWGLFNYLSRGFARKPVDWYFRPFFLARRRSHLDVKSSKYCFGNEPHYVKQIGITRRVLKRCKNANVFTAAFYTEMTHDSCCHIEMMDGTFRDFFKEMHTGGYFNKTVVMVMSDHGHRYGGLRAAQVGLLEERLPMMAITFPPWFYKLHPNIKRNLEINQYRLSSPFDIHETFKDILNSNYNGEQRNLATRGLSQLFELPANRTCHIAGIPEQWCTCTESKGVDINDAAVKKAASFLMSHVNKLLMTEREKCVKLRLKKIGRAEVFVVNQKVLHGLKGFEESKKFNSSARGKNSHLRQYRVLIEADPSAALLEGLVHYHTITGVMKIENDVSRINKYGNQSACIQNPPLRKFCYCIKK